MSGRTDIAALMEKVGRIRVLTNHLIDADRFSQILIQRLLINITSIEGIDMSIISDKIMKVLCRAVKAVMDYEWGKDGSI